MGGAGYLISHYNAQAGLELAGFNHNGQVAVTNLLSTVAWASINLSKDLEIWNMEKHHINSDNLQSLSYIQTVMVKRAGPHFISSPFLLESTASWGVNYSVTHLYQNKAWTYGDWVNSAFSIVSGTLWDGMSEALPSNGLDGHFSQALSHTFWGAAVNMLPNVISKGSTSLKDSDSWLGATQNSMVFSALFSNLPDMYRL